MMFSGDAALKIISVLSGGENSRVLKSIRKKVDRLEADIEVPIFGDIMFFSVCVENKLYVFQPRSPYIRPRKITRIIGVFLDKMLCFQLNTEVRGQRSEVRDPRPGVRDGCMFSYAQ